MGKLPENLSSRIASQFSAGGYHLFTQHDESALPFQPAAHSDLFRRIDFFAEAARSIEGFASTEDEAATGEPRDAEDPDENRCKNLSVSRNVSVIGNGCAAAHCAVLHGSERAPNNLFGYHGICIDEDQAIARGGARPGVTNRRYLPAVYFDNAGTRLAGDLAGSVGRSVVGNDYLERLADLS